MESRPAALRQNPTAAAELAHGALGMLRLDEGAKAGAGIPITSKQDNYQKYNNELKIIS